MTLLESIRKNALGLGLFAIFTAGVIVVTQSLTADMIEENQQQYRPEDCLHRNARSRREVIHGTRQNGWLSRTNQGGPAVRTRAPRRSRAAGARFHRW